ncbi:hypothetical protein [Solibacillus sp. FSL K6-1523]|uniref:hypothetical protein n=1 Tax=Solibacillus sp. FSL K6-1523 TaxID=2921471 RepID=UPI0030F56578
MTKKVLVKYTVITSVSALTLAGCGGTEETVFYPSEMREVDSSSSNQVEIEEVVQEDFENNFDNEVEVVHEDTYTNSNEVLTEEYTETNFDEELVHIEESEYYGDCGAWQESDDGSSECIDENSPLYSQHFFNGLMFASLGALAASGMYKSMNKRDGENRSAVSSGGGGGYSSSNTNKTNSYSSGKQGFSSGGTSRGGSASS